jgi:D-alanyl-D-alanine carboxypeptidase
METKAWMTLVAVIAMVSLYSGCNKKPESSGKTPMPQYLEAEKLVEFEDNGQRFQLHPDSFLAWERMRDAAKEQGVQLDMVSAFRSIKRQSEIVERKRKRGLSEEDIFKVSARPGYSEHHTGKAIDLTTPGFLTLEEEFEKSEAFKWLMKNGNNFGFHLSYPRDNKYGIIYEPWHWRFKGTRDAL